MDEKELQALYNAMSKQFDIGDWNTFKGKMQTTNDRKRFYDVISKEGFDLGDYATYESRLTGVKKKETPGSVGSNIGSIVGGKVGASKAPSLSVGSLSVGEVELEPEDDKTRLRQIVNFKKNERPFDQTKEEAVKGASEKFYDIVYGMNDNWKDPIKASLTGIKNSASTKDALDYYGAKNLTEDALMPDGFEAKRILSTTHLGQAGKDNLTANALRKKTEDYEKTAAPFRNINPQELTYLTKDKVYDAAIRAFANKSEHFKNQLKAAGIDLSKDDIWLSLGDGDAKRGEIMRTVLNDTDMMTFLQKEKPELIPIMKDIEENLIYDNKDFGRVQLANEISRDMQKGGYNRIDPVFNLEGNAKEAGDATAEALYANDPKKLQFYRENKDEILSKLDAPSLFSSFAEAGKGFGKGILNTFTEPFTSTSKTIKENWEKEASHVSADPKGLVKFLSDSGHALGFVASIGATGNVLGLAGITNPKTAGAVATAVGFFGDQLEEGRMKYPNSPVKAVTSAALNTGLYAALSFELFPAAKVEQAFKSAQPGVSKVVENLASGRITRDAAKKEFDTLGKRAIEIAGEGLSKNVKVSAEMTGIGILNKAADKIMGLDEEAYKQYHPEGEEADTFKSMFLSNVIVNGLAAYGTVKSKHNMAKESIYEAAGNPNRFRSVIEASAINKNIQNTKELLDNLDYISNLKKELDARKLTEKQKKDYLYNALQSKVLNAAKPASPEAALTRKSEDRIKDLEEINAGILEGKEADEVVTTAEQKAIDEKNKETEQYNKLVEQGHNAVTKLLEETDKDDKPKLKGIYRDIAKDDPMGFLQEIADQAFGMERVNGERVPSKSPVPELDLIPKYGADVVNAAKKLFPLETKSKQDAIQKQITDEMDVRQQTGDGEGVVEGNAKPEITTGEKEGEIKGEEEVLTPEQMFPEGNQVPMEEPSAPILETTPTEISQPIELSVEPTTPQPTATTEGEGVLPPEPPATEPPPPKEPAMGGEPQPEFKNEPKAILNRINQSKNIGEETKKKFEEKGLRYIPQSHESARNIAKGVVDEFGVADSISMAEAGRFDGDVNSMIFAEGIDRTFQQEQAATTQAEKIAFAEQWADYAIRYDETARQKGRFISAIYDFYKKSPLGVILTEKAKRDEAFKDWFTKREKPFKEVWEELQKEAEFEEVFKEKVEEKLKEERKTHRQKRRKKIEDIFNNAKLKGDQLSSSIIPPQIWNGAVEAMKQAALLGESVVSVIEKGVEYIKSNHTDAWDEKAFREEWRDKLASMDAVGKPELTTEERKQKVLEKFRKRLSGLNEQQKEEVIRKSFKKLVDNGALEYEDFKKIIAETLGFGELTPEEVTRLSGFVKDMNDVQDLADNLLKENSKEALAAFEKGVKKAERSATKLAGMLYTQAKVGQRLRSIIQLNTLGLVSLIKNPFYNIFHQLLVRFPKGVFMTAIDQTIYGISLLANKIGFGNPVIKPDINVLLAQKGYFSKGSEGSAQAVKQVFTGLTNKDYFQKEVYNSQIKPFQSWRDLWGWSKGRKTYNTAQIADRAIQGTIGIPAEVVARMLNIGDKPFRYAAEGAIAETIATQEFNLKGIEREIFLRLPKEKAKQLYMKKGLSEEKANEKAELIEKRIVSEGEEAVFQQSNVISYVIGKIKEGLTPESGGHPLAGVASGTTKLFGVLNMPYVKTPVNIAWEAFNLVNPEFALFQSLVYGIRAAKTKNRADVLKSKKWLAHAATGWALLSATAYIASIGALSGDDEDEPYKAKEAKGKATYEKGKKVNLSKLFRAFVGDSVQDEDGDVSVDLSWFGVTGMIMNMQANKYENMTKEERENMSYVEEFLNRLRTGTTEGLTNSVFQGTLTAVDAIRTWKTDQWMLGMMNVGINAFEPATLAQISRATRPYEYTLKGDDFSQTLKNTIRARFFGKVPPKVNIWGEQMKRDVGVGDVTLRMLGISRYDKDAFGEPIHQDFKRTGNANFYPPAVSNKFSHEGKEIELNAENSLEFNTLVGQARQNLVAPYVNSSSYKNKSDEAKIKALQKIYEKGREYGKKTFLKLHPEVLKK